MTKSPMKYSIDSLNWPSAFPEKPEVTVEVTNNQDYLFLHFFVKGEQLRALTTEDQGHVWEDSCVEFFCQVPGEDYYLNFETNCIGAMVASRRRGRNLDVQALSPAEMAQIERRCTFPRQVIAERDGWFAWEVELRIPLHLIFGDNPKTKSLRANFYKCADKTKKPHYLSWQPISLPQPDFHCPQFFAPIVLD